MSSRIQRFSGDSMNFLPQRQNSSPAAPSYLIEVSKTQKTGIKEERHMSPRLVKGSFKIDTTKRSQTKMNPFGYGDMQKYGNQSRAGFTTSPVEYFSPRELHSMHKGSNSKFRNASSARRVIPMFEEYNSKATHQSQNTPHHMLSLILQKNCSQPTSPKTRRQISKNAKLENLQAEVQAFRDGFIERWMIHRCQHASAKVSRKHQTKREDSKVRCVTRISFNSGQSKPPYVLTERKIQNKQHPRDLDHLFTDPGTDSITVREKKKSESSRGVQFHKRGSSLANAKEMRRSLIFRKLNFSKYKGGGGADSALSQDLMSVCSGNQDKENKEADTEIKMRRGTHGMRTQVKEAQDCRFQKRAHSSASRKDNTGFTNLATVQQNWKNRQMGPVNQKLATRRYSTANQRMNKSKCMKREVKYPPPSGAIVMPNIRKYEDDTKKDQILSQRQRPRKMMKEINNLFAKYSIDGTGSDFTTPGAGSLNDYAVGKQIGQGAYAIVKLAVSKKNNQQVAIKVYQKYKLMDPQRKKSVLREIKILSQIRHQNILKLYEVIETPRQVHIVTEYVPGLTLYQYVKTKTGRKLPQIEAKTYFKQIVQAMAYCHDKNIAHRDLKLENFMMSESKQIKVIDFGFACVSEKKMRVFCGTPSYMAPQIVQKREYNGTAADVWALGVLLFAFMHGFFPFKAASDRQLYRKISKGAFSISNEVSQGPKSLILKMLVVDPLKRITTSQILRHPWIQDERGECSSSTNSSLSKWSFFPMQSDL